MCGSCIASSPFCWKTSSTKMPFLPRHLMKNFGRSTLQVSTQISRWTRDTNVECPTFTSTSSRLVLRPIVTRDLCIVYSNSWPSRRASGKITSRGVLPQTISPDAHAFMFSIVCLKTGASRSARRAQASLSETFLTSDMIRLCRQQISSTIGGFWSNGDLFTLPASTYVNNKHARLLACAVGRARAQTFLIGLRPLGLL